MRQGRTADSGVRPHDLGLAAAHADRVGIVHGGGLAADGPPAEVFEEELPSRVHRQPVEVFPHPRTGVPQVVPRRSSPDGS